MESNKLGRRIQDWAAGLGFTLPDGSAPPANHFALLTATPHRRQLWEVLIESIQSRQKIEHMRKQILVAKLKERKKYNKTSNTLKQAVDRFDLWQKQNTYEVDVKEKRNAIIKFKTNIMTKASDSLFEVCKVSELEKLCEEFGEKSVVLKLLMRRKKKIMEDFEMKLLKLKTCWGENLDKPSAEVVSHCIEEKLLNIGDCKCLLGDSQYCDLVCGIEGISDSIVAQQSLWEEAIKCKRILLEKFARFLADMNSSERSLLSEKEREIEKVLQRSITQLKQRTTEKSLQMIINSTKGKELDVELERLEESLFQEVSRAPHESTLNESFSYLISGDLNGPGDESEKALKNVSNYLRMLELQKYEEFLKEEVKRVEEGMVKIRRKDEWKNVKEGEEELQLALKAFDCAVEEIDALQLEDERLQKEIFRHHATVEASLRSLKEEINAKARTRAVEEAAEKVKSASEKQIHLLLETPLDVFRTVESSSGRILFECESASQYLQNYGGEFKQFFSAMLIPPRGNLEGILSEVRKRKSLLEEVRKIISERGNLTAAQRKLQHELSSIKHDKRLCETNFKDSEGILRNVLCKTDVLFREVDYIEKILKNWVEQPYRSMIKETVWGKGLKEMEEKHAKGKNE